MTQSTGQDLGEGKRKRRRSEAPPTPKDEAEEPDPSPWKPLLTMAVCSKLETCGHTETEVAGRLLEQCGTQGGGVAEWQHAAPGWGEGLRL